MSWQILKREDLNLFQKKEILQLQVPQLFFLLDDLSKKLEYSLSSSAKTSFSKVIQTLPLTYVSLYNRVIVPLYFGPSIIR